MHTHIYRVQGVARTCCDAVRHLDAEANPGAALVAVAGLHLPAGGQGRQAQMRTVPSTVAVGAAMAAAVYRITSKAGHWQQDGSEGGKEGRVT